MKQAMKRTGLILIVMVSSSLLRAEEVVITATRTQRND